MFGSNQKFSARSLKHGRRTLSRFSANDVTGHVMVVANHVIAVVIRNMET